jgi:hypothetical protein
MRTFGFVVLLVAGCLFAVVGCKKSSSSAADAGANAAAPEKLQITIEAIGAGGKTQAIPADGSKADVESVEQLAITTNLTLRDYRVRVTDEAVLPVKSNDAISQAGNGQKYLVKFAEPLKAGKKYTLTIDTANGPTVVDSQGKFHAGAKVELHVKPAAK